MNNPILKKRRIADYLRDQIVSGELSPGARLPTRLELERQFGVSTVTVQQALDALVTGEFVRVNGRRGTFVSETPPHLTRYALVIREHPTRTPRLWTRFESALCDEAARIGREGTHRLAVYSGVEPHVDDARFCALAAEVRDHRLAGLVFLNPRDYEGTSLLEAEGIARVIISADAHADAMPVVNFPLITFWDKALDHFAALGRRRVAVLLSEIEDFAALQQRAAARGLEVRPQWTLAVSPALAGAARNCVHLLLHAGQKERPDALLITDDNLVEAATLGVLDAGVRAPDEVEIVAHCNFPYPAPGAAPVTRLGFDVRRALETALSLIDAQRRGDTVPAFTNLPARFETEIAPTQPTVEFDRTQETL